MNVLKTNKAGIIEYFKELADPKAWWPLIPKDKADYYILLKDDIPLCFVGIVQIDSDTISIEGLYASKIHKDGTAVFELMDYIGFHFMDKRIKIYVINEIALFGWKRIGFKVLKSKKMKYWTAYWIEREALYGKTKD